MKPYKLLILLILILICGCWGYRVGTLLPGHIQTVTVPNFKNSSGEPNIETPATNAVIDQINIDGTLKVVDKNADALLEVEIVGYVLRPLRYDARERAREYRLTISVLATLTDLKEKRPLWTRKRISGNNEFFVRGNLPATEREAIPDALEDLAHDIVEQVVEGWE